jgi:membrane protease YdiL (CAAX protease family)
LIGLTFVVVIAMGAAQGAAASALAAHWNAVRPLVGSAIETPSAGHLISIGTLAGGVTAVTLISLLVIARRCRLGEYLALRLPTARQAALAVMGLLVFITVGYSTSWVLGQPLEPPMVVEIYRTGAHILFSVAAIAGAAIGEEVVFRGFLYEGIASSSWGPIAAILISAVAWAALHYPFGFYAAAAIGILGLYLGTVRYHTRSLPLTILLHGLNNAIGIAVIAYLAQRAN